MLGKKRFIIIESAERTLNEEVIEVEVPSHKGDLRTVKLSAEPMMNFVVDQILNNQ